MTMLDSETNEHLTFKREMKELWKCISPHAGDFGAAIEDNRSFKSGEKRRKWGKCGSWDRSSAVVT
jgi:hypothetical protein